MSDYVKVGITPIILSYFAEKKCGTRRDITITVYKVMQLSRKYKNISIDSVMRVGLNYPYKDIRSETFDGDLSYWLSNKFISRIDEVYEQAFYLNDRGDFEKYKLANLYDTLYGTEFKKGKDCKDFVNMVELAINGLNINRMEDNI